MSTSSKGRALIEAKCTALGLARRRSDPRGRLTITGGDRSSETLRYYVRAAPEPDGGKEGAPLVLPWRFPDDVSEDWIATVDLQGERVWLFRPHEIVSERMWKQHKGNRFLLSIYLEPTPYRGLRRLYPEDFEAFLLERRLGSAATSEPLARALVRAAEAEVAASAGEGQGFGSNSEIRNAIEQHAMARAVDYFSVRGFEVEDVSSNHPYDLLCRRNDDRLHVEVKGSTSRAAEVFLTRGEVEFAESHPEGMALFICANIAVTHESADGFSIAGGDIYVLWPWRIDKSDLLPVTLRYRVPDSEYSRK